MNEPKRLHVVFRAEPLDDEGVSGVAAADERAAAKGSPDEAAVVDGVFYLRTPDGLGRSVLAV